MTPRRGPKPMDSIIRLPRRRELSPTVAEVEEHKEKKPIFGTTSILLIGFALLILLGGALLTLPAAHHGTGITPMETAFFTSVSAVTVTGHTLVNSSTYWSTFGQVVIFTLMLVGGLGFMVVSTFILLLIGQKSTLQERMLTRGLMRDTVGVDQMGGLRHLSRAVIFCVHALPNRGGRFIRPNSGHCGWDGNPPRTVALSFPLGIVFQQRWFPDIPGGRRRKCCAVCFEPWITVGHDITYDSR